jgi:CIC family chloride channel protein
MRAESSALRDFTVDRRVWLLSGVALIIGAGAALLAAVLLKLILLMPRSILTEKLGRRGHHLTREYGVDPLEIVIVGELMSPVPQPLAEGNATVLPLQFIYEDCTCRSAAETMATEGLSTLPVVDRKTRQVLGSITLEGLLRGRTKAVTREQERLRMFG